ncbi:hypothetical protein [Flavobacterium branchiicola]|uniref:Uncharacterized protein n=1 Tax=Flavobacterium branchiicola TaxID=1114875 RepID=A0ABV9PJK6_9FLAO|nr:hypothetical protein [Flavobacterium branchiicola]MBS7256672.1 hypothetical protein [Flavobacterium branchiicola]
MDSNFINTRKTIFDSSEPELYKLSNDQKVAIENSRMEIKNGNFHKNEEVISEMRKRLKKK